MNDLFRPISDARNRNCINEWKKITEKNTILISFIADSKGSNFYSSRITNLIEKLKNMDIDFIVKQYPADRYYHQNCCFKPVFINSIIKEFNKNVVWIDGDTNLKSTLDIFIKEDKDFDIGLVSYTSDISSFVASPIFFRNTDLSRSLIDKWDKHCTSKIEAGICELDHDALKHSIIPEFRSNLRIKLFNNEYHRGEILENVNSEVPGKIHILHEMTKINPSRPFHYNNSDFKII